MTRAAQLSWLAGLALLLSCEPRGVFTQSQVFDFVRDDLATECCNCLSRSVQAVPHPEFACPGDLPAGYAVTRTDAGILDDGSQTPDQLRISTSCLCGEDKRASTCRTRLARAGEVSIADAGPDSIEVVGLCVDAAGVCYAECNGVLAFP